MPVVQLVDFDFMIKSGIDIFADIPQQEWLDYIDNLMNPLDSPTIADLLNVINTRTTLEVLYVLMYMKCDWQIFNLPQVKVEFERRMKLVTDAHSTDQFDKVLVEKFQRIILLRELYFMLLKKMCEHMNYTISTFTFREFYEHMSLVNTNLIIEVEQSSVTKLMNCFSGVARLNMFTLLNGCGIKCLPDHSFNNLPYEKIQTNWWKEYHVFIENGSNPPKLRDIGPVINIVMTTASRNNEGKTFKWNDRESVFITGRVASMYSRLQMPSNGYSVSTVFIGSFLVLVLGFIFVFGAAVDLFLGLPQYLSKSSLSTDSEVNNWLDLDEYELAYLTRDVYDSPWKYDMSDKNNRAAYARQHADRLKYYNAALQRNQQIC
ncbi:CIC11C00000002206 [Sungouiella intermedia]|uniref:CIC11C00000002206 n=1 Tax=Sungouiella intermedia TaxID=45354 RepID=A0A1L0BMG1_9ASCO|nr:CIC11C00000002206 [[Candida] intermedia]